MGAVQKSQTNSVFVSPLVQFSLSDRVFWVGVPSAFRARPLLGVAPPRLSAAQGPAVPHRRYRQPRSPCLSRALALTSAVSTFLVSSACSAAGASASRAAAASQSPRDGGSRVICSGCQGRKVSAMNPFSRPDRLQHLSSGRIQVRLRLGRPTFTCDKLLVRPKPWGIWGLGHREQPFRRAKPRAHLWPVLPGSTLRPRP